MIFHFVIGHELGHVSFSKHYSDPSFQKTLEYIKSICRCTEKDEIEECYCDWIGTANCMYQARPERVPTLLVVLSSYAAWLMANVRSSGKRAMALSNGRRRSMHDAWCALAPSADKEHITTDFNHFSAIMSPCFYILAERLERMAEVNVLLNPEDEDRTRSLNRPGDHVATIMYQDDQGREVQINLVIPDI
jgi:hypothetical protein